MLIGSRRRIIIIIIFFYFFFWGEKDSVLHVITELSELSKIFEVSNPSTPSKLFVLRFQMMVVRQLNSNPCDLMTCN